MSTLPATPSASLDGQHALVTGGSSGIGLAAAAALGRAGARVTLAARRPAELEAACDVLRGEGIDCCGLPLDVTDPESVDAAVAASSAFDILVNNAGMNRPKPLAQLSNDDIDAVLDLNVKAVFYVTRAVSRQMVARGQGGAIINVSSQMGHVGSPGRTLYCASKHAIEGMTKALAWELGEHGIRVNSLCPTFIETAMTAPMFAQAGFADWVRSRIALGRPGQLAEVMGAIVFLASAQSSLMTGSALMLDGGWTAA
ncbi:SDR family NAD(P)-dependent oxidoreductase [Chitinasiproducens palmae]|uniref:NAD(P)-dependent dehydrogenase, short-chain alcohol dehydrogenase family n=1 Tax=Chitinasiproducens palmae TaxID=1770053 RepID=A0A1H2PKE6_9BURK|nr:SDR family oxidoreductase [Chitinasiproducens palmae]SDV46887.1 NAD(P)-dependent dehydrogenase, short-chain alcohol dehydrogenase family [Chitinasiproducens palmae]